MKTKCDHPKQKRTDRIAIKWVGNAIEADGYICSKCSQPVFSFEKKRGPHEINNEGGVMKKPKAPDKKKEKKKAWAEFSRYIRLKYAIDGYCQCVTCGVRKPWKKIHAGHFIAGRGNSILFDERGVHPQCYGCNICRGGHQLEYYFFMENTYGRSVVDELRALSKQPLKRTVEDYIEIRKKYKKLADDL